MTSTSIKKVTKKLLREMAKKLAREMTKDDFKNTSLMKTNIITGLRMNTGTIIGTPTRINTWSLMIMTLTISTNLMVLKFTITLST